MACKKIPYVSRADANRAAKQAPGQRVYACPHCDAFHLSSKNKRQVKDARKRGGRMLGDERDVTATRVLTVEEAARIAGEA